MKYSLIFAVMFWGLFCHADNQPSAVRAMLSYGSEFRPQKNVEGHFEDGSLKNWALGAGYKQFVFVLEKAQFESQSGNSSLNVQKQFENIMLWTDWRASKMKWFSPFVGAGLGAYKESAETAVLSSRARNESTYKMLSGAAVGVSLDVPVVWASLEARILFGDEFNPQPLLGGLARIGVWF